MKRTGMQKKTIFAIVLMVIITAALSAQQNADYFISEDGLQAIQFETPADGSGTFSIFPVARNRVNTRSPMGRGSYRLDGDGAIITAIEYLVRRVDNPYSVGDRIGLSPALIAWRTEQRAYIISQERQQAIRFEALNEQNFAGGFTIFPVVKGVVNTQRRIGVGEFRLAGRSVVIRSITYTDRNIVNQYQQYDILDLSPSLEQVYERLVTRALQTDFNEADFTVTLTSDQRGVVINRYNGTTRGGRIPATIQGMPVQRIANEAFSARRNANLTAIAIPEGVTSIGDRAFAGCGLLSVALPQSLTSIGSEAFRDNRLGTISLPNSLTAIGANAFTEAGLTEITIPGSVRTLSNVFGYYQRTNRDYLLKTVTINEGVTLVNDFWGYEGLVTLNIPASLQEIGGFQYTGFRELSLPEGLRVINTGAFQNCRSLTSITLPSSLIMGGAFSNLPELTQITFPAAGVIIMGGAFANIPKLSLASQAALTEHRRTLPQPYADFRISVMGVSGINNINININGYTGSAAQLTIPGSILSFPVISVTISSDTVTSLVFSEGITLINNVRAPNLTNVSFPSTIRTIENNAFAECSRLTTVTIPASVQSIGFGGSGRVDNRNRPIPDTTFRGMMLNAASQEALRRVGYTGEF